MNVFDLQALLTLDSKQYDQGLASAEKKTSGFSKNAKIAFAAVGAAIAAVGAAILKGVDDVSKYGDEVDKMSQKLGLSAEAYQKWDYVLKISGTEMSSMTTGLKTLTNKLDDAKNGSASAQQMFAKLGLSMEDVASMSREDIFEATIRSLAEMEDSTERAALANDLFGRSGQNLAPLFNLTNEEIDELISNTEELGMVMSDDAVKASAEYQDALTTLKGTMGGIRNAAMSRLLPIFTDVINGATEMIAGVKNAFSEGGFEGVLQYLGESIWTNLGNTFEKAKNAILENFPELEGVFSKIVEVWNGIKDNISSTVENIKIIVSAALTWIQNFWNKWGTTILSVVSSVFGAIQSVISTVMGAIENIIAVVTGIISGDWSKVWEGMANLVSGVWQGIYDFISNILGAIWSVVGAKVSDIVNGAMTRFNEFKDKVKNVFEAIKTAITNPIQAAHDAASKVVDKIKNFFNFKWELPHIKLPHFSVSGSANPINWLTQGVPRINVEWYKKAYDSGFLFKNPTIIPAMGLGEGVGSELLIGESKLHDTIGDVVDSKIGSLAGAIASVLSYMEEYFPQFANRQMVLDSGTLVGELTPAFDVALGTMQIRRGRGQ